MMHLLLALCIGENLTQKAFSALLAYTGFTLIEARRALVLAQRRVSCKAQWPPLAGQCLRSDVLEELGLARVRQSHQ